MPYPFNTPEYKHLLLAERTLVEQLTTRPEDAESISSSLVKIIDQKRIMRGQGAPKPVESRNAGRSKSRRVSESPRIVPLAASVAATAAGSVASTVAGSPAAQPAIAPTAASGPAQSAG